MKSCIKKSGALFLISLILISCELVDTPIEPDEPVPTRNVRYVVQMSSSSANSNPIITYTNFAGGSTEIRKSNLDLFVQIDSGTTAYLSASCSGLYSPITLNSSAAVDIKMFIADSLVADSTILETANFGSVIASASISTLVK